MTASGILGEERADRKINRMGSTLVQDEWVWHRVVGPKYPGGSPERVNELTLWTMFVLINLTVTWLGYRSSGFPFPGGGNYSTGSTRQLFPERCLECD